MEKKEWITVFKSMTFVLKVMASDDCGCDDPGCESRLARAAVLDEIINAWPAVVKASGLPPEECPATLHQLVGEDDVIFVPGQDGRA